MVMRFELVGCMVCSVRMGWDGILAVGGGASAIDFEWERVEVFEVDIRAMVTALSVNVVSLWALERTMFFFQLW